MKQASILIFLASVGYIWEFQIQVKAKCYSLEVFGCIAHKGTVMQVRSFFVSG